MTRAYNTATTQQNSGGAVAGVTAGKNYIINGGMDFWQRGTSFTSITQSPPYTMSADRWSIIRDSGTTYAASRQTGAPDGFQYCFRFGRPNGDTNTTGVYFGSALETASIQQLAGKTVTISFYARKGSSFSASGSTLSLIINTSTSQEMTIWGGGTTSTPISSNFTITSSWQRFTATGTIPSGTLGSKFYFYYNPVGTAANANDYIEITGVQLEEGSVATPFSRAGGTIQGELAACQRYYWRNTLPTATAIGYALGRSTTSSDYIFNFPVPMRINPTALDFGGSIVVTDPNVANYTVTSATFVHASNYTAFTRLNTASSLTQGKMYIVEPSTNFFIGLSAEL